jgi:hypothetical protein
VILGPSGWCVPKKRRASRIELDKAARLGYTFPNRIDGDRADSPAFPIRAQPRSPSRLRKGARKSLILGVERNVTSSQQRSGDRLCGQEDGVLGGGYDACPRGPVSASESASLDSGHGTHSEGISMCPGRAYEAPSGEAEPAGACPVDAYWSVQLMRDFVSSSSKPQRSSASRLRPPIRGVRPTADVSTVHPIHPPLHAPREAAATLAGLSTPGIRAGTRFAVDDFVRTQASSSFGWGPRGEVGDVTGTECENLTCESHGQE